MPAIQTYVLKTDMYNGVLNGCTAYIISPSSASIPPFPFKHALYTLEVILTILSPGSFVATINGHA